MAVRGQLKYMISTSSQRIEAGKEFSISISITNPFDIPITLKSVTTKLPTEFIDVSKENLEFKTAILENNIKKVLKSTVPTIRIEEDKKKKLIMEISKEIFRAIPIVGSAIAAGASLTEYIKASNMATAASIDRVAGNVTASDVQRIVTAAETGPNPETKYKEEMINVLSEKVESIKRSLEEPVILQPGNSTVQVFTIRTKKALLFIPSNYVLHIEMQYEADGLINQDITEYTLSIGSSLISIITGSIIGSLMGYIVKDIFNENLLFKINNFSSALSYVLILFANIILGIITVIIFSRKKDIQPILAIEDFWGGILLGFIVGYTGKSFLEKLLPSGGK